nr:VOC family protein [uncultured Microbacterium sp.]
MLPPRIHLDIYADDHATEVSRLTELGARTVAWENRPDDAGYVTMEDPEGNRFCIVDRPEWRGWERDHD